MKKHIAIFFIFLALIGLVLWDGGGKKEIPERTFAIAVRTGFVTPEVLTSQIKSLGTTEALMDVDITTEKSGKVTAIHFDANQAVKAGELLVELDSEVEQAALQEAKVTLAEDKRVLDHYEKLIRTRAVSQTVLDEQKAKVATSEARLAAAQAALSQLYIKAPFSGVLGFRLVSPGTLVEPGDSITTLDAIDVLKLEFSVPEFWIGKIQAGDSLAATSVAYPGKVFNARVFAVGNRVDPVTRAVILKARIDNSERLLKPGMSLEVVLNGAAREVLLIAEEALLQEGSTRFVYVVTADNKVERRPVETGIRKNGVVEIVSGLKAGEQIVREGAQKVRPGSQVTILANEVG